MSETIPENNLPVFLQKYNVTILNEKEESVGEMLYSTVGAIPSNEKGKRVWQLNLTGHLKPNIKKYNITYDFSKVDYKYKDEITFQNIVSGVFNICGRVLDASKIIGFDYTYSESKSTLTIRLDTSKWNFQLKKKVLFSYQLNIDDSSCPSTGASACFTDTPTCYPLLNSIIPYSGSTTISYNTSLNTPLGNGYTVYDVAIVVLGGKIVSYNVSFCRDGKNNSYPLINVSISLPLLTGNTVQLNVLNGAFYINLTYNGLPSIPPYYIFSSATATTTS